MARANRHHHLQTTIHPGVMRPPPPNPQPMHTVADSTPRSGAKFMQTGMTAPRGQPIGVHPSTHPSPLRKTLGQRYLAPAVGWNCCSVFIPPGGGA